MAQRNQNKVSTQKVTFQDGTCDCASAPVWMTALFDDSGTKSQMQAGREHLKNCSACARVWREWSATRDLMVSAPVPVVPSSLLEQALLSCRLLPAQDAIAQSALENEIAFEELARYINAPEAEYSEMFAAPLGDLFGEAPLPADLKSRILQLTVETESKHAKAPVYHAIAFTPVWQVWSQAVRDWNLPRAGRWGFALAVPTMAAWVLMVSPAENLSTDPINRVPQAFQSTLPFSTNAASIFPKNLPKSVKNVVDKVMALKPPLKAGTAVAASPLPVSSQDDSARVSNERPAMVATTVDASSQPAPQFVSFSIPGKPAKALLATQGVKPLGAKGTPVVLSGNSSTRRNNRRQPVIDMARTSRSRSLSVTLSSRAQLLTDTVLKRLPSDEEREVSTLNNVEPRKATQTLVASTDFDETLESVGRMRDDRPEELGVAVDTYRASLLDQSDSDDSSEDEFYDQL